jgi:hypothetical protein
LPYYLETAHRQQDKLAAVLEPRTLAGGGSSEWSLRGEILTHVDRLRTGLRPEIVARPAPSSSIRLHRVRAVVAKPRRRPGQARPNKAQQDKARHDKAWHDKALRSQDKRDKNKRGKRQRNRRRPGPGPARAGHGS